MPRPYHKKSAYWDARSAQVVPQPVVINTGAASKPSVRAIPFPEITYGSTEIATAGAIPDSSANYRGRQTNNGLVDDAAFQNIRAMPLPWASFGDNRGGYLGARDSIELACKAYMGVPIVRNAVEISVEFSNQPLYIKTDNESQYKFLVEWFNAIKMSKLKEEFFREYYRSGNVFFMKFSGKFGPSYYKNFQQTFGAKNNKIPIRYILLNPANIFVPTGLTTPYTYTRLLSTYEIERLKNPLTEQDKQVYKDLPEEVKTQIQPGASFPQGLYIPLEPDRLRFVFYKKQSYEPLAVPMVYPVLPDIEAKLAMKKMDMMLARSMEHAILLVTTGETGTEHNGGNGINPNNIIRLQNLFTNQTIGRVLVADYTTKAQWLIPDIKEILGPEKYKVINEDIKEGLQSILTGEDKFANAQIKAKIFIQRLEEGQESFLSEFLMPEIIQICEDMGFRTVPKIGFRKIDLQDETVMARIYAQLGQLGILTAEEVVQALETNILPDASEMDASQSKYKKDRDAGKYLPLVGGTQEDPGTGGAPGGKTGAKPKKPGPIGTSRGEAFSAKMYTENLKLSNALMNDISEKLQKKFKIKDLNDNQQKIVESLAKSIMAIHPADKWKKSVAKFIESPLEIPREVSDQIDEIRVKYEVDDFDAILLMNSKTALPQ